MHCSPKCLFDITVLKEGRSLSYTVRFLMFAALQQRLLHMGETAYVF